MMPKAQHWTGAKRVNTAKVTPELLAMMVDLLPTIGSLRELCAVTGLTLDTVRREVAPFLAIMKMQGTHPQCGCGRDRFHPYGCVDSRAKSWPADCIPGRTRERSVELLKRRQIAIEMLTAGARQVDVDTALGMAKGGAKNYLTFLTPEQMAERERRQQEAPVNRNGKSLLVQGRVKTDPRRPFSVGRHTRIASALLRRSTGPCAIGARA